MSPTLKKQSRLINEANAIIHRRNLYFALQDGNRRVYNAHMHLGEPVVEDLHSGVLYSLLVGKFIDGNGQPVEFSL